VCQKAVGLTARSQLLVEATVLGVELSGPILSESSRTGGGGGVATEKGWGFSGLNRWIEMVNRLSI
jgi:hypothetical protein